MTMYKNVRTDKMYELIGEDETSVTLRCEEQELNISKSTLKRWYSVIEEGIVNTEVGLKEVVAKIEEGKTPKILNEVELSSSELKSVIKTAQAEQTLLQQNNNEGQPNLEAFINGSNIYTWQFNKTHTQYELILVRHDLNLKVITKVNLSKKITTLIVYHNGVEIKDARNKGIINATQIVADATDINAETIKCLLKECRNYSNFEGIVFNS